METTTTTTTPTQATNDTNNNNSNNNGAGVRVYLALATVLITTLVIVVLCWSTMTDVHTWTNNKRALRECATAYAHALVRADGDDDDQVDDDNTRARVLQQAREHGFELITFGCASSSERGTGGVLRVRTHADGDGSDDGGGIQTYAPGSQVMSQLACAASRGGDYVYVPWRGGATMLAYVMFVPTPGEPYCIVGCWVRVPSTSTAPLSWTCDAAQQSAHPDAAVAASTTQGRNATSAMILGIPGSPAPASPPERMTQQEPIFVQAFTSLEPVFRTLVAPIPSASPTPSRGRR